MTLSEKLKEFKPQFPSHTIICHPYDYQYIKDRAKSGVNVLSSTYIELNKYIKSKDLLVRMTEPETGWDKDDYANDRITIRCEIQSIEAI